jgi:nucleoporin NUP82
MQLQREYARLLPGLKDLLEKDRARKKKIADTNQGLGVSQAFHLGEISNYEYVSCAPRLPAELTA